MFVSIQGAGIDRNWELAVVFDALFVWLIVVFLWPLDVEIDVHAYELAICIVP